MSVQHAAKTDTVARASPEKSGDDSDERHNFAVAMEFESFEELLGASNRVESNDGHNWYLTPLKNSTWGAWNDTQLLFDRHYATREEALASIPHEAELTGTAMLG